MPNYNDDVIGQKNPENTQHQAKEVPGQEQSGNLKPNHIRSIFQNQGRSTIDNQEHILVSPNFSDPAVKEYSEAGDFTVTQIGSPAENGECTYELRAEGKPPLKITVGRTGAR